MFLLLASHNPHKKKEIELLLPQHFQVKDLNDLNIAVEIEEHGATLEENAMIKARYLYEKYREDCLADDSALEITSLSGAPGVYSARFAGPQKNDHDNIELVLKKLEGVVDRRAQFKTVIALLFNGQEFYFEGIIRGEIALSPKGSYGFGYDPIFIPEHYNQTFAELGEEIKSRISHRSLAIQKMIEFLKSQK